MPFYIFMFAGNFLMHFSAHPRIVRELARPCKCECPRLIQELHGLNERSSAAVGQKNMSIAWANGQNGWGMIDRNNYMTIYMKLEVPTPRVNVRSCLESGIPSCARVNS